MNINFVRKFGIIFVLCTVNSFAQDERYDEPRVEPTFESVDAIMPTLTPEPLETANYESNLAPIRASEDYNPEEYNSEDQISVEQSSLAPEENDIGRPDYSPSSHMEDAPTYDEEQSEDYSPSDDYID